jgi:hypothetical protein
MGKAHSESFPSPGGEFLRREKPGNREVFLRGLEILPEGQHATTGLDEIPEGLLHLPDGLPQAEHEPGLGGRVWVAPLGIPV